MVSAAFYFLAFLGLVISPQKVGDELDEATNERMRRYAEEMQQRMAQLLLEIEALEKQQSSMHMGALLLSATQYWQFWAGVVVALLFIWNVWLLLRDLPEHGSEEESSSSEEEELRVPPPPNDARDLPRFIAERVYWPFPDPTVRCALVEEIVGDLLHIFDSVVLSSFFPNLQRAIGVGSAFEGWNPHMKDPVYRLLVPMTAPRGHSFHLELGNEEDLLARKSSIRVELECTCEREQDFGDMLCFLHHSEEELKKQGPSLLSTLCTDSYLDAEKTARWFQNFVKSAWVLMPQSEVYNVEVLPSTRTCKFQLTGAARRRLTIEIVFGVQQEDSDIFLSSQMRKDTSIPSTTWPQSCSAAERKFFQHVAREGMFNSIHLKCMQVCAHLVEGTVFPTYVVKTIVMHLLTNIPMAMWHKTDFLLRMDNIMQCLHGCVREKRLDHFFFGNEMVPDVIVLPPSFQNSEPINLFQYLKRNPYARADALQKFEVVRERLRRLITYGHERKHRARRRRRADRQ
ncbi:inositol 1,4,5-trisphosphate receptor-interacting protein-like 1 [Anas acuta]|uniref:inositol 1,4,5-trisphosphate receptor-interacting protein-like 1 n=1 Tax=Anas acuta TaxID=28680 RepID=UPI0035C90ACA